MNNAGTVLLTLADMSVIQAEVEVDETNIPNVQLGQPAKITIDALPDRTFKGHVTRDRQQPDPGDAARRDRHAGDQLQGRGHARRADAGRAARLHLHRRHHDRDAQGRRRGADSGGGGARADLRRRTARSCKEPTTDKKRRARRRGGRPRSPAELKPGQTRKETEGVFVVRDGNGGVRADQDGHRRRQVLRGARRASRRATRSSPARTTRCAAWPTATRSRSTTATNAK